MDEITTETQEQSHMFDEAAASQMISALDDESAHDADLPPDNDEGAEKPVVSREKQAFDSIYGALKMYEIAIKTMLHKKYVLDDDEREEIASGLAPAIIKYVPDDEDITAWIFGKFEVELKALYAIYLLGSGTLAKVKELKTEDARDRQAIDTQKSNNNEAD